MKHTNVKIWFHEKVIQQEIEIIIVIAKPLQFSAIFIVNLKKTTDIPRVARMNISIVLNNSNNNKTRNYNTTLLWIVFRFTEYYVYVICNSKKIRITNTIFYCRLAKTVLNIENLRVLGKTIISAFQRLIDFYVLIHEY